MATLSEAKKAYHEARGLHARSGEVDPGTYARYMQFTGGDELPLRAVVQSRTFLGQRQHTAAVARTLC